MQPAFGKECRSRRVICSTKFCNSWLSYWISVPGDWLSQRSNNTRKTQSFSHSVFVWKWRIYTVLWHRRVQHSWECIQSLRRCWVTRDTKSSHRHRRALFLRASRRHPSTKATVGPWDRGKFETRFYPGIEHQKSTWNRTWNFRNSMWVLHMSCPKAHLRRSMRLCEFHCVVIGVVCYSKELWLSGTWYLLLGAFINFTSRRVRFSRMRMNRMNRMNRRGPCCPCCMCWKQIRWPFGGSASPSASGPKRDCQVMTLCYHGEAKKVHAAADTLDNRCSIWMYSYKCW